MINEIYRDNDNTGSASITETGNVGEIRCELSVTGGNEVPADSDISEFGVFTSNGRMVYHEVTDAVTVTNNETVTFVITIDVD